MSRAEACAVVRTASKPLQRRPAGVGMAYPNFAFSAADRGIVMVNRSDRIAGGHDCVCGRGHCGNTVWCERHF